MPINPYINFPGNCREAVEYYARVFHCERPQFSTFGEMPAGAGGQPMSEETKKLIMHTELVIDGTTVMFNDVPPGMPLTVGNNISLTLATTNRDQISNAYNQLKEGGQVVMDLQETFWSKLYAFLIDKYGIGWQLSLDSGEVRR